MFLAQVISLGMTTPSYFYFFYVSSPLHKYSTASARQIDGAGVLAVLPALLVAFFVPHAISLVHPDYGVRHFANWIWQFYPVSGSMLLFAISSAIRPFLDDRSEAVQRRNKTAIRAIGGFLIALSVTCYWSMILLSPLAVSEVLVPRYLIEKPESPLAALRNFFQWDYIVSYTTLLLWLAYHFADLKSAGICQLSWARILVSSAVIGCLGGPGVLVMVGWITREEMMASAEHTKTS